MNVKLCGCREATETPFRAKANRRSAAIASSRRRNLELELDLLYTVANCPWGMASAYTKICPNLIMYTYSPEMSCVGLATYFDDTVHECQLRMRPIPIYSYFCRR